MCIDNKMFVTEPSPFDTHGGVGPCEVRVVAMLVHMESAIVTVVSAASAGVARLGLCGQGPGNVVPLADALRSPCMVVRVCPPLGGIPLRAGWRSMMH